MAYGLGDAVYKMIGDGKLTTSAGRKKKVKAKKTAKVMHEFKHGTLHSGSKTGKKVTNRKQAIAIALSEANKAAKGGYGKK